MTALRHVARFASRLAVRVADLFHQNPGVPVMPAPGTHCSTCGQYRSSSDPRRYRVQDDGWPFKAWDWESILEKNYPDAKNRPN